MKKILVVSVLVLLMGLSGCITTYQQITTESESGLSYLSWSQDAEVIDHKNTVDASGRVDNTEVKRFTVRVINTGDETVDFYLMAENPVDNVEGIPEDLHVDEFELLVSGNRLFYNSEYTDGYRIIIEPDEIKVLRVQVRLLATTHGRTFENKQEYGITLYAYDKDNNICEEVIGFILET